LEVRHREAHRIAQDHRRLYQEWKKNPKGPVALLNAFAVDPGGYF
jgi:hypothetical protein